jgi:hemerythrin
MAIRWTPGLSVGNPLLDAQHRKLIEIVNRLAGALDSRQPRRSLAAIADELERYVALHFHHEEAKLRASGYPELDEHLLEHRRFETKLTSLLEPLRQGSSFAAATTLRWLTDWVGNHIQIVDRRYAPWLASAGAAGAPEPSPESESGGGQTPPPAPDSPEDAQA